MAQTTNVPIHQSDDNGQMGDVRIESLGNSPNRHGRALWKKVDELAFEEVENHISSTTIKKKKNEKEFFILYAYGELVGRAAATVDQEWLDTKEENVGFIDDFVIRPGYEHLADVLIQHCLHVLKDKGVEGVIARSHQFPALAAEDIQEVPPFGLPCNPSLHIGLFERNGFIKEKEWTCCRLLMPPEPTGEDLVKSGEVLDRFNAEFRRLNMRSRREVKEYNDLSYNVLVGHFGYTPMRFMETDSLIRFLIFGIVCRLVRLNIYIARDRDTNEMFGFASYLPAFNNALKTTLKQSGKHRLLAIPRFLIALHRTDKATIGAIGLADGVRGKGFTNMMDHVIKAIRDDGFKQADSGPMLVENTVVVYIVEKICSRHSLEMKRLEYHTLLYRF